MLFKITGRHIEVTDALRQYAEEKASKLSKYYNSINQVEVVFDGNSGSGISVEIIARAEHSRVFVVSDSSDDAYKCIDSVIHKMERQLSKHKGKERERKHP